MEEYKPYSDGRMEYDFHRHRYSLTADYLLSDRGIDLDTVLAAGNASDKGRNPELFLRRVSDQVYGAIYTSTPYYYKRERALALYPRYRDILMEAMSEQAVYLLHNGDLSAYTGVDAVSLSSIDRQRMQQSMLAPMAYDMLVYAGLIRLAYTPGSDIIPDYEGDGY